MGAWRGPKVIVVGTGGVEVNPVPPAGPLDVPLSCDLWRTRTMDFDQRPWKVGKSLSIQHRIPGRFEDSSTALGRQRKDHFEGGATKFLRLLDGNRRRIAQHSEGLLDRVLREKREPHPTGQRHRDSRLTSSWLPGHDDERHITEGSNTTPPEDGTTRTRQRQSADDTTTDRGGSHDWWLSSGFPLSPATHHEAPCRL